MPKKVPFTEEQMEILRDNKYTHSVTPNTLVFTLEFKQFFFEQAKNRKKTTRMILEEAGYDTSLFTGSGISKIRSRILEEGNSEKGFKPPRGLSTEQRIAAFEAKDLSRQNTEKSLKEMQERIIYLEKQIEFLKKISHIRNQ